MYAAGVVSLYRNKARLIEIRKTASIIEHTVGNLVAKTGSQL